MSDLNGNVVGIQGTPVSANNPTQGDILKYNGTSWEPAKNAKMHSKEFLEDGYWEAPQGVDTIIITGWGGGGGGSGYLKISLVS